MPVHPALVSEAPEIESVTVTAPCTTANLGPGFDVFALALEGFLDTVHIQSSPGGVTLEVAGPDSVGVPADPELNTAGLVAKELLSGRRPDRGVKIRIEKGIPVGKGIGSSAASAAGTAVALNHMLKLRLTMNEIVQVSAQGEVASSGSPHADNVAAAVLGGFTFVQSYSPFSAVGLSPPRALEVAIAIPDAPTPPRKTGVARAALPERVPLGKVAHNVGGAASIVAGILSENIDLIGKGMVDAIVEPARAHLVPGYAEVKKAALEAGAEGAAISGAGPSMIAIIDNTKVRASSVAEAMREAFESVGVESHAVASKPACGAAIIRE
jgi:homoserine kinase